MGSRARWVGLLCLLLLGCQQQIQHGLDERQANELLAVLTERGFEVAKVPEKGKKPTWAIEVAEDQAVDAVRVLAELGLPRARVPTTAEVLGSGGLVPTPGEERSRQVVGLAGDLSATLEAIDGVTSARVHLVLPPAARPGQAAGAAKASAFLRVRPGAYERVSPLRDQLRALVAGSVEGLNAEAVTLVITEVPTAVAAPPSGPSVTARLRALVVGLGVAVSGLAVVMVWLSIRLRQYRQKALVSAAPAPQAVKPVIVTAARKVS